MSAATGRGGWLGYGAILHVMRRRLRFVPLVVVLEFCATLLEGLGVGLLIPLISLLADEPLSSVLPRPILSVAGMLSGMTREREVVMLGTIILALIAAKAVLQAVNAYLSAWIEARNNHDLRIALARRVLDADYRFVLDVEPSRLLNIIATDVWRVAQAIKAALSGLTSGVALAVLGCLLLWLEWRLALLAVGWGGIIVLTLRLQEKKLRAMSAAVTTTNERLGARMVVVAEMRRLARLFNQQGRELETFAASSEKVRRAMQGVAVASGVILPGLELLLSMLFVAILVVGHWLGLSIATQSAFVILLARAQPYFQTLTRSRLAIASVRHSIDEVEWLLENAPMEQREGSVPIAALDGDIVFDDVSYDYPNGTPALEAVSFTIHPGRATALIGHSGAGKSTVVNLLCGLLEPSAGTVSANGTDLREVDVASLRSRIAFAGQDADLASTTIHENIAYGSPHATREDVEEAARMADIDAFIRMLPLGYETPVGWKGLNLSGGERQRIGLARALVLRPDLLILDEATSAVDGLSEGRILEIAERSGRFRTILVISHRKDTLVKCSEGIVLERGRIIEAGPIGELEYYRSKMTRG